MSRILIIDDDVSLCRSLQIQLRREGHGADAVHTGADGVRQAECDDYGLVLLDLGLPDEDGLVVLQNLLGAQPDRPVVVVTARQDMTAAVAAMRDGAFDYVRKPFELVDILLQIEKTERSRRRSGQSQHASPALPERSAAPDEIVGNSAGILAVIKQIGLLSRTRVTVLIQGESGTGKELVARALHAAGAPGRPFVAVNCSAVVPTLFESELFGHEKGAFTGADARRMGRCEQAQDGTLFLDEIGDMPLELQSKLLRVLQERSFDRVGGNERHAFDARIVAATNRDLKAMIEAGTFREDLYFRLAVSQVILPPLRERRGDIPLIARHLVSQRTRELHSHVTGIDSDALELLSGYDWPGNIRELENVLTRAIALSRSRTLMVSDFEFLAVEGSSGKGDDSAALGPLWQAEKRAIVRTLAETGGNITRAAGILAISRTTLRKKINDFGIR